MISTNNRKRYAIAIAFMLSVTTVFAGGRREDNQNDATGPRDPGTRIEMGNPVDRETNEAGDERERSEENTSSEQGGRAEDASDDPIWLIVDHEIATGLEGEISSVISDGYVPTGLDLTSDAVSLLYVKTDRVLFDRWTIQEFAMDETLNDAFSSILLQNWLPMGISIGDDDTMSALFVRLEDETPVEGWRLQKISTVDLQEIFSIISDYREDGFIPYGIALNPDDSELWLLMVQTTGAIENEPNSVLLNAFRDDEITAGITADIANGALPWGMARGSEASFFSYILR